MLKDTLNSICDLLTDLCVRGQRLILEDFNECIFEVFIDVFAIWFMAAVSSAYPVGPELYSHVLVFLNWFDRVTSFSRVIHGLVCIFPDRLMVECFLRSDRKAFLVVFDTVDLESNKRHFNNHGYFNLHGHIYPLADLASLSAH